MAAHQDSTPDESGGRAVLGRAGEIAARYCGKLGCRDPAALWIDLRDGRERPVCETHRKDGEVIGAV